MQGADTQSVDAARRVPDSRNPVTWSSLPHKPELFILFLCRLADFLQVACLQTYIFHQLKSIAPELPNTTISAQLGWLHAAFPGVQVLTATIWGSLADSPMIGRKNVLLVGLIGTGISLLGLAFSTSFTEALIFRIAGGASNGTVGVIRTMVAELAVEKHNLPRAILILPVSFYVAAIVGPVLGGSLSNPQVLYSGLFGPGTLLGGGNGVVWMTKFPYALPAIGSSGLLFACSAVVYWGLDETLDIQKDGQHVNNVQRIAQFLRKHWPRKIQRESSIEDKLLMDEEESLDVDVEDWDDDSKTVTPTTEQTPSNSSPAGGQEQNVTWKSILTHRNVLLTFVTEGFYDFHMGAFTTLLISFLSSPRTLDNSQGGFAQGLSFTTGESGIALTLIGIIGLPIQLLIYPKVHDKLGTLSCYRIFATIFPLTYAVFPILALIPGTEIVGIWSVLVLFLAAHTVGRAFTLPVTILLLNECAPHPGVLGFVHGVGQSIAAAFRTIGYIAGGYLYAWGLSSHAMQLSWWVVALEALMGCLLLIGFKDR